MSLPRTSSLVKQIIKHSLTITRSHRSHGQRRELTKYKYSSLPSAFTSRTPPFWISLYNTTRTFIKHYLPFRASHTRPSFTSSTGEVNNTTDERINRLNIQVQGRHYPPCTHSTSAPFSSSCGSNDAWNMMSLIKCIFLYLVHTYVAV